MSSTSEKKSHEPEDNVSDEDGRGHSVDKKKGPKARFREADQVFLRVGGQLYGPYYVELVGNGRYLLADDAGNYVNQREEFSPESLVPVHKKK